MIKEEKTNKIHDLVAKAIFSERGFLEPFVQAHLPEAVRSTVRWDEVIWVPLKGTHVDTKQLKEPHADIVYEARYSDGEIIFWIHVECQSSIDETLALRLINYQTGVLLNHWKANRKKPSSEATARPPVFLSFVFYHGLKPYPRHMIDWRFYFSNAQWAQDYTFQPFLIDLSQQEPRDIQQHPKIAGAELAFKYILEKDFSPYSPQVIKALEQSDGDVAHIVLDYLIKRANLSKQHLLEDIANYLPKNRELAMQLAQQYEQDCINRGMKRGMERGMERGMKHGMERGILLGKKKGYDEGRLKEKRWLAESMLKKAFDLKTIHQLTQLSQAELNKLQQELEEE